MKLYDTKRKSCEKELKAKNIVPLPNEERELLSKQR
jgi:hypothetical protein